MMTKEAIHSELAVPPGEYLEEVIRELGMTKDELAHRMDRPASKLSPIFKGKKAITPDTALQLEKVVGVAAHIWTGLEAEYRLTLARQHEARRRESMKEETDLVKAFCYKQLAELGAVAKRTRLVDQVLELQKFFGVTSLKRVLELGRYRLAFRCGEPCRGRFTPEAVPARAAQTVPFRGSAISSAPLPRPEAVAAWLRLGETRAQQMVCAPFERVRLQAALKNLRALTGQPLQESAKPLRERLGSAGVALVFCPPLPGVKARGATFWLGRDKAVVMATLREKWADAFWFNLFHEIGHVFLHDRQTVILEDGNEDSETQRREREADQFASDHLVPRHDYEQFVKQENVDPVPMREFAVRIGIEPGIVVGLLQHHRLLKPGRGNKLRTRLKWTDQR